MVHIDDLNFKNNADCLAPLSSSMPASQKVKRKLSRAMWVWEVKPLLFEAEYQADFFLFCREQGIKEIFLQIPYQFVNDLTPQVECKIQHINELRRFIKISRGKGILVHALDGNPEFVLEVHHPRVLSQVRAIISFNASAEPEERYFGIHLDNEPYLLLGFDGKLSERIMIQYLELNRKIMSLLRDSDTSLVYGVDIPFWFDEARNDKGQLKFALNYGGKIKDASQHIMDMVDNVGIMNYRNFAGGADGMIRHGQDEVHYANKVGKTIYLGVETFRYDPAQVYFIYGIPNLTEVIGEEARKTLTASRFKGYRVRRIRINSTNLIGLVQPPEDKDDRKISDALIKLSRLFSHQANGQSFSIEDLKLTASYAIGDNPEYNGFDPFVFKDLEKNQNVFGFKTTEIMLEKITFAGKTKREMEQVLGEVADNFRSFEHFFGFAIHYYKSYKSMRN